MKKLPDFLWGFLLIVLGGFFLASNLGLIADMSPFIWSLLFGGASLLCLATFAARGREQWGWLIPACVFAGLALTIWLAEAGVTGTLVGALFLWSVALPFWLVYFINRPANRWALIPGWALVAIGLVSLLSERAPGELLGALVMFSIGLPFIIVYLSNRAHWWALIPGGIMSGIGLILLLVNQGNEEMVGALVLLAVALPFAFIYLRFKEHWWALIPAGILVTLSLIVVLSAWDLSQGWQVRLIAGTLFLGAAVPFIILWWQRDRYPTAWARYPAVGLLLVGALAIILGPRLDTVWPAILILVGLWLLFDNTRRPRLTTKN